MQNKPIWKILAILIALLTFVSYAALSIAVDDSTNNTSDRLDELPFAYVGVAPPIAALYEDLDAKIVAGVQTQGSALVIRPELVDEYEGPASLKGKTIATFPPGSIQHTVLSKWFLDNGIDPEGRGVEVFEEEDIFDTRFYDEIRSVSPDVNAKSSIEWHTSDQDAMQIARSQNKPTMIFFL
jgi:hypothetical protein